MLEKDPRWTTDNFEQHCKNNVPEIYLKESVNKDVRDSFRIVKKLAELSFFEWEIYDVAAQKAMVTFELALKKRYFEITQDPWPGKKPLKQLIDWFHDRGYFEVYHPYFLERLRMIRNHLTHHEHYWFGGAIHRQWIASCADLINDLYEDTTLRKERMSTVLKLNADFKKLTEKGAPLTINGKTHLIHSARVGFINNKVSPSEISVIFIKPFKIGSVEGIDRVLENPYIILTTHEIDISENTIHFADHASITSHCSPEQIAEYKIWMNEYTCGTDNIAYDQMIEMEIGNYYQMSKLAFHKMDA